jgi:hypothetical protein
VDVALVSRAICDEKMDLLNLIFQGVEGFTLLESRKVVLELDGRKTHISLGFVHPLGCSAGITALDPCASPG